MPAQFVVTRLEPLQPTGVTDPGNAGATFGGQGLSVANGSTADSPLAAIRLAVSGSVTATYKGVTATYNANPATIAANTSAREPFVVYPAPVPYAPDIWRVALEDLQATQMQNLGKGVDWDYNDRYWYLKVQRKSEVILTDAGSVTTGTNELKVAKWEDAFEVPPNQFARIKGPDANGLDFIDRDRDRFNVRVYDIEKWRASVPTLSANLWTTNVAGFTAYDDPTTAIPLVRVPGSEGWYTSDSQILVSNAVDDEYSDGVRIGADESGAGATYRKNGLDFPVSDRTHRVALRGRVRVEYNAGAETASFSSAVPVAKVVNVHVTVLQAPPNAAFPNVGAAEADRRLHESNERYAQVGILLIPTFAVVAPPPEGVVLGDGFDADTEHSALTGSDLRSEDPNDIELYFANEVTLGGEAIGGYSVNNAWWFSADRNAVIISARDSSEFTVAHEIGHVLLNDGAHYSGPLTADVNLMVGGGTSPTDHPSATSTKRLTGEQQATMLSARPSLLSNP